MKIRGLWNSERIWWALVLVVQKLWVLIIRELNSKMVLREKGMYCENASNSGLCPITVFAVSGVEPSCFRI